MEQRMVVYVKTFFMVVGAATCLLMFLNGASDFFSRHQISAEVLSLTTNRYAWQADDESARLSTKRNR
jgi:hypothetical protein